MVIMDNPQFIYQLLEVKYLKSNGREIAYGNLNEDLYPSGWFSINSYDFKIEVLKEALEKNIKIVETDRFQEIIEGAKRRL